jgi:hypothetical protein
MLRTKEFNYNQNPAPEVTRVKRRDIMTFKITIKEVHEAVVEIDAENYFEALAKVETDYWENPNDYLLEPKDTTFE